MSELRPTKTRLALLQAVAKRKVWHTHAATLAYAWWQVDGESGGATVTARCDEQVWAGWIVLEPAAADYRHFYEITDAGRAAVLRERLELISGAS